MIFCNCSRLLRINIKEKPTLPNLILTMNSKMKYLCFQTKESNFRSHFETRTCNPYNYPKGHKCTRPVRKVSADYKKIISKHCRINDILKCIHADVLFPMNSNDYVNLLSEVTKNSSNFSESLSMHRDDEDINGLKIFQLADHLIQDNYFIIQKLIYIELEKAYPSPFKNLVNMLKRNLIACMKILNNRDITEDWMFIEVVENFETYISNLKTICIFVYLIIFKRKSRVVNKMFPPVLFYTSTRIRTCRMCEKPDVLCRCFVRSDCFGFPTSTLCFNREDAKFWQRYLERHGFLKEILKHNPEESSSDSD